MTAKGKSKALKKYQEMRDFTQTAEPSGRGRVKAGHSFVVQKHAASHLHYDFRLEMDGVLRSWALAKGPSVDPAVKRLAMQTEDHPLAYGGFEGLIPKGQYGGGTVMLWDRGTWESIGDENETYKAGRMKFRLHGDKMNGQWALVRMKPKPKERNPAWLLIKDKDEHARPGKPDALLKNDTSVTSGRHMSDIAASTKDVWFSERAEKADKAPVRKAKAAKKKAAPKSAQKKSPQPPAFIEPQLTTRVDAAPAGDGWLHEIKFDGYRLHARVSAGKVNLLTRRGQDWTDKFEPLLADLQKLDVDNAYLDGEAVVLGAKGLSDFSGLQNFFTTGKGRLVYYAFDLLFLNGEDLRRLPLLERKKRLHDLLGKNRVIYSDHQLGSGPAFFKAAANMGVEGIISKQADAAYESGRGRSWLKIKRVERQEFVIGGYMVSTVSKSSIGALLMGEYIGGKLVYVGKVGTGYTNAMAADLFKKLSKLKRDDYPFDAVPSDVRRSAVWVDPKLVAEVEFAAWTSDHVLRHAAFQGLREDKPAKDVHPEKVEPVKKVVAKTKKPAPSRATAKKGEQRPEVLGIGISSPERTIYPDSDITKLEVAAYYAAVAAAMLPHVAERPLALVRCPDGVGPACFFQKHAGAGLPDAIREERIGKGKDDTVLVIDSAEGLVSLVQRGVLEIHTWGSRLKYVEQPDMVVFDFDPDEAVKWPKVVKAAVDMRAFLKDIGLTSFVKTTGGKGLHVVVPLKPQLEWEAIKEFTRTVADKFAATDPDAYLINMSKAKRKGKIFIDYLRNGRGSTAIAPYSTRARPGALIATPLSWAELEGGAKPQDFGMEAVIARVSKRFKDPWKDMLTTKQGITEKTLKTLMAL